MLPVARLPDWRPRLHLWLQEMDGKPFVFGNHDCCLFGAGAVAAQTGVDLAAGWRGRYTTMRGGLRVLRRAGYTDHIDLIARHLAETPRLAACEGDIAVIDDPGGRAVGVVQGSAVYVLHPSGRLGLTPLSAAIRVFRVD
jgi:hypothetical protein